MSLLQQLGLFQDAPIPADAHTGNGARSIQLDGRIIPYRFARSRRRSIGLRIDTNGLTVAAPVHVPWHDIERFMQEKARWILQKLDDWTQRGSAPRVVGAHGERIPYLGTELSLHIASGPSAVLLENAQLCLWLHTPDDRVRVRKLLIRWLKARMLEKLTPRAAHYAWMLRRPAPRVRASSARTQWGLCTAEGEIRLSWRLIHVPEALADYVVAHEVAHLIEMNHSKRFWAIVERLYPDWRHAKRALDQAAATLPIL